MDCGALSAHTSDGPTRATRCHRTPVPPDSKQVNRRHRLLRRGRVYGPDRRRGSLRCGARPALSLPQHQPGPAVRVRAAQLGQRPELRRAGRRRGPGRRSRAPADRAASSSPPYLFVAATRVCRSSCTVRGGAYFFLPGIRALRYLSSIHRPRLEKEARAMDPARTTHISGVSAPQRAVPVVAGGWSAGWSSSTARTSTGGCDHPCSRWRRGCRTGDDQDEGLASSRSSR